MHYVITGSTGTVGKALARSLIDDDHRVTVLTRRPARARRLLPAAVEIVPWSVDRVADIAVVLRGVDVVVNLAGASIGGRPWTAGRKRDILDSRTTATTALVEAIASLEPHDRPSALINASGIDYYGDQPTNVCIETSPSGDSFLAGVCRSWESAAVAAEALGVRVVVIRTAFVVARDAPAFRLLTLPFRAFVGGPLGSGTQPFTWIHIDDLVVLYRFAAANPAISGPLNAVAPQVATQAEVAAALGRAMHRPSAIRVPARVLRLVMGDLADLLLHGRIAQPRLAIESGYTFQYPNLRGALDDVLGPKRPVIDAPRGAA